MTWWNTHTHTHTNTHTKNSAMLEEFDLTQRVLPLQQANTGDGAGAGPRWIPTSHSATSHASPNLWESGPTKFNDYEGHTEEDYAKAEQRTANAKMSLAKQAFEQDYEYQALEQD